MTLEESVHGLAKIDSNGVDAYIDGSLYAWIEQRGNIYIDYQNDNGGSTGFTIAIKRSANEQTKCC